MFKFQLNYVSMIRDNVGLPLRVKRSNVWAEQREHLIPTINDNVAMGRRHENAFEENTSYG